MEPSEKRCCYTLKVCKELGIITASIDSLAISTNEISSAHNVYNRCLLSEPPNNGTRISSDTLMHAAIWTVGVALQSNTKSVTYLLTAVFTDGVLQGN